MDYVEPIDLPLRLNEVDSPRIILQYHVGRDDCLAVFVIRDVPEADCAFVFKSLVVILLTFVLVLSLSIY